MQLEVEKPTLQKPLIITSVLFILLNCLAISFEIYWLSFVPIAILLVLFSALKTDIVLYFIAFSTPLSYWFIFDDIGGTAFSFPTEPLMFGLMILFVIKMIMNGQYPAKIARHPVTILLILMLSWQIITVIGSSMPMVSLKYFISNTWAIVSFYFFGAALFTSTKKVKLFLWLYIIPLTFIIVYSVIRHANNGFTYQASGWVMEPFIKNHGIYGAVLAFFIPYLTILFFKLKYFTKRPSLLVFLAIVLVIFIVGIIFSYTRAAWLGLAGAAALSFLLYLRISFKTMLSVAVIAGTVLLLFSTEISMSLGRNKTDSNTDLSKHVKSISNVSTDASNLERINRWNSALRMFKERPVLGWGPGTYMFQYAPYQKPSDKTIISTNIGDVGGIHSEYFNPFVESGTLGGIFFLLFVITLLATGINTYYDLSDKGTKLLVLGILLGLTTYLIHGVINNYLDTDKTAVLFWAFSAILVSISVNQENFEAEKGN